MLMKKYTCGSIVRKNTFVLTAITLIFCANAGHAEFIVEVDSDTSIDTARIDGAIAMDLMGSLWTISPDGGQAQRFTDGLKPVSQPRWSPDGTQILYLQEDSAGSEIWQITLASGDQSQLVDTNMHVQDVAWHPSGERLVYTTDPTGGGLDIWEADISTGLRWRLSNHVGDEIHPTWSANGKHLAYVHRDGAQHRLILREHGEPEVVLLESDTPLAAPSWRPDGSLLTYFQRDGNSADWTLNMAILSSPPLLRSVSTAKALSPQGVSWPDRMRMVYSANGQIMTKGFADRRGRPLHFRALVNDAPAPAPRVTASRELEIKNAPEGALIIRGKRLFDGISNRYHDALDILIEDGLIVAVEPRREWPDATVLDLGEVTIIPGLIDSWSALPQPLHIGDGAGILAYGITTLVSPDVNPTFDAAAWEGDITPGPRLLPAAIVAGATNATETVPYYLVNIDLNGADRTAATDAVTEWHERGIPVVADRWAISTEIGIDVFLGADSYPGGRAARGLGRGVTTLSVLADATTPDLPKLLQSRQAQTFGHTVMPPRRIATPPELATSALFVVAGSRGNGLPAGLALHAELKALSSAGRGGEHALYAAGRNAAQLLGLRRKIGTISPGAVADLLLVNGDPLSDSDDALKIVAVVRNGRFFSLVRLLDQAQMNKNVE
jgi:TolB protein